MSAPQWCSLICCVGSLALFAITQEGGYALALLVAALFAEATGAFDVLRGIK